MSRFDRRLKPKSTTTKNTSPRPGVASCKLRTGSKKPKILSGFIEVTEKNEKNTLIQEVKSSNLVELEEDNLEKTMKINNILRATIVNTKNPTLKRLLSHELRLNTLEVNLDCLTDLKCSEISEQQNINQEKKNIDETIRRVGTFDDKIKLLTQENIEFKKSFTEINDLQATNMQMIDQNSTEINNKFEVLNEIQHNLQSVMGDYVKIENFEKNNERFSFFNDKIDELRTENRMLKEKMEKMENVFTTLIQKLNDPDIENYDDILYLLN